MTAARKLAAVLPFTIVADAQDEDTWKRKRVATIGASESAIVLGASPASWSSPLKLWAVKTGKLPHDEELEDAEYVFWGKVLEPSIIEGYRLRSKRTAIPFGFLLRSTRWPWLSATPDAMVTDDPDAALHRAELVRTLDMLREALKREAEPRVIEGYAEAISVLTRGWWPLQTKNIGFGSAEHWVEGVPLYYRIQCTQESLVFGTLRTTGAALIAGQRLAWDDINIDERGLLERQIVNLTQAFMRDHIDADVEPPTDGTENARQTLAALYPLHTPEKTIALGGDWLERADAYDAMKAAAKDSEKKQKLFESQVRQEMQDAERLLLPDGSGFTWKTNVAGARVLLRKKAKEQ